MMMNKTKEFEKYDGAYDFDVTDYGVRCMSFMGMKKKIRNLHKVQDYNRPIMEKFIISLGYDIIGYYREKDGWGDGLIIDHYLLVDKRDGSNLLLCGNDDNTALYEKYESGGKGIWKKIPDTKTLHKLMGD